MTLTTAKLILICSLSTAMVSCTHSQQGAISALTPIQQSSFDALNKIQTSTDEKNRLYSTFANIDQPFYPADTSFEVSQSELLLFFEHFISKHCRNLDQETQVQLAKTSVLAQKEYTVLHCQEKNSRVSYEQGLPMSGTWVLPNVLGRRDVILRW